MRLRLTLGLCACLVGQPALAAPRLADPSLLGRWWAGDRDGVIEVYACGNGLCGRIVGQPDPRNAEGGLPLSNAGVPECGLTILRVTKRTDDGRWWGTITNPDDGKEWNCEIWLAADGAVRLRGYVLLPVLGQTQTWQHFTGHVGTDCRIS